MKPFIIGIAGGSGSGKTTLTRQIIDASRAASVAWIPFDAYYRDLSAFDISERQKMNFDHPDAFDTALCLQHLDALADGQSVVVPEYDFVAYTRAQGGHLVQPRPVIIVDGIVRLCGNALIYGCLSMPQTTSVCSGASCATPKNVAAMLCRSAHSTCQPYGRCIRRLSPLRGNTPISSSPAAMTPNRQLLF